MEQEIAVVKKCEECPCGAGGHPQDRADYEDTPSDCPLHSKQILVILKS